MKRNRIFGALSALALLASAACSSDNLAPGEEPGQLKPGSSGGVYMTIDFKMSNGSSETRSETDKDGGSTGGTEIGSDEENYVTDALIVLASTQEKPSSSNDVPGLEEYGFIVAGTVQNNNIAFLTDKGTKQYRATACLQKENLNTFYGLYWDESQNSYNIPPVYVFVFCNPTKELTTLFTSEDLFGKSDWIKKTCTVIQGEDGQVDYNIGIWGANTFLMNNVNTAKRRLPEKLLDWEYFTSVDKPFHLSDAQDVPQVAINNSSDAGGGSVLVERSVARFDFKDGSKKPDGSGPNDNTYNVLYQTDKDGNIIEDEPIVNVQLLKMCLVNMGKEFYYLPRVSPDGQNTDITLLGAEKPWARGANGTYSTIGNYVVGPNAITFAGNVTENFSNYFNYPFFDNDGKYSNPDNNAARWNVVKIEDVLKGNKDNYTGPDGKAEPGGYHIWRYVTENLIPGGPENQNNGISTGVVFKGKLGGTAEALDDVDNDEYWDKGSTKNIASCLNGGKFNYTSDPSQGDDYAGNGEHEGLTGNSKLDPILYYFNGKLYMGWRHIRQAAIQASVTKTVEGKLEINRSTSLYKAVFGDGPIPDGMVYVPNTGTADNPVAGAPEPIKDERWTEANADHTSDYWLNYKNSANYAWSQWAVNGKEEGDDTTGTGVAVLLENMRKAVTGAGITIYQSATDTEYGPGYYCYYYYWNRHNDNEIPGTMGPMEFDVVRNNVYKLSVDKISRPGHPRIPENDPDSPTPETPDESDEIYLDVRVQIVPWAVRLNSIVF